MNQIVNRNVNHILNRATLLLSAAAALSLTGCWERPPIESAQTGYRGTAMVELTNPRMLASKKITNPVPEPAPAAPEGGPTASTVYKNVPVLGNLSVSEFTRTMVSLTNWVAPAEGCNYCHKPGDPLDSDALYTKVVARKMLQMTQAINSENKAHVGATGVTCYTCHRGEHVPVNTWSNQLASRQAPRFVGTGTGQNRPAWSVGLTSLPYDPYGRYLSKDNDIRVTGNTALRTASRKKDVRDAEATFGLMVHMSNSLGVNCTYCHNSQAFDKWSGSTPQRVTAWHGIRMVRAINNDYLDPLVSAFPDSRKGPAGDVTKVNCTTCHQGENKPLYGAQMAKHYPALLGKIEAPVVVAVPAAAAPAATIVPGALVGKVLFATGKTVPDAENRKLLDEVIAAMKANPDIKVDLSGFADKTGNPTKNLELAKQRALSVRDALKTAGIDAARIQMKKPEFAVGGVESDARRVDIVGSK
jgi:photosynthetic reaction center cytochrome c subunit